MRLGIMQPYFFPYLGYFALIEHVDKWIVFDITQYTKKTWINRNRILNLNKDWSYITAPVKKMNRSAKINEVEINNLESLKKSMLNSLKHYEGKAPYYDNVLKIIETIFSRVKSNFLVEINNIALITTCNYLNINYNYLILSRANIEIPEVTYPGGWALEISKLMEADEYLNPINGKDLFLKDEFDKENIKLSFLDKHSFYYKTIPYKFIEDLSIIDVLMWNDPEKVKLELNNFKIV